MNPRHQFWYSVYEDGESWRYSARSVFRDPDDQAVDAAEDYWNNHDGWESRWPRTFYIYASEDGPLIAACEVEMETEPHFYARRVELAAATSAESQPDAVAVDPHVEAQD